LPCAMQVTTKACAAAGAGAESVRLENAMPVLPLCPTLVRVRARAALGLELECVREPRCRDNVIRQQAAWRDEY